MNRVLLMSGLIGGLVPGFAAHAVTVFADDFDDPDNTLLNGKASDVGGGWFQTDGPDLEVIGGQIDTTGAGRQVFGDFAFALGAGEMLTMTYEAVQPGGDFFAGWSGVSLFDDVGERFFVGSPNEQPVWGIDESGVGQTLTGNGVDAANTATFQYTFDTGDWTLSLATGEQIGGLAVPGVAASLVRIANGGGGDIALDSILIDISEAAELIPGDTDSDGDVDVSDLQMSIVHFTGPGGLGMTRGQGDTDNDGDVDNTDLSVSLSNFTGATRPAAAVPEPASSIFGVLGGLAMLRRRR